MVLGMFFLGAGGQFEKQLAIVLLVVFQQLLLLADFLQAQGEGVLAVVEQGQHLVDHALFEQAFLLRNDAFTEQVLEIGHTAAREQRAVATHLGQ